MLLCLGRLCHLPKATQLISNVVKAGTLSQRHYPRSAVGKAGDTDVCEAAQGPTLPVRAQAGSWKEGLQQHQLVPSVEGEVGRREDYRAQLPGQRGTGWGAGGRPGLTPVPTPCSLRPGLRLSKALPPLPSGQDDKQGWNRTSTGQDGMSSGQSRSGGPCSPHQLGGKE